MMNITRVFLTFFSLLLVCLLFDTSCKAERKDPRVIVTSNQTIPGFPHRFDVYRSIDADTAVIFLHGASGGKNFSAQQLGLKDQNDYDHINEEWIIDHKIIFVLPQGQALEETPLTHTWSNHVMDSGQDDMTFLQELVQYIKTDFGVDEISLAGHSNGGMMVNRVWCEEPELFNNYISLSGPMSEYYLNYSEACKVDQAKPYFGIVGSQDSVIQVIGNWNKLLWKIDSYYQGSDALLNPFLINESKVYNLRKKLRCGKFEEEVIESDNLTTWFSCNSSNVLMRVEGGEHAIESLEEAGEIVVRDLIYDFIRLNE